MKNFEKTISGLVLILLVVSSSFGQAIDQNRMDRDLEIAENILQTISNNNGNKFHFSNHSSESSYIPDFGVIFSYPNNNSYIVQTSNGRTVINTSSSRNHNHSRIYTTNDDCEDCDKKDKADEKTQEELKKEVEEWKKKEEEAFKEHATDFLVDYADLINQLKPTDKIMVTTKNKSNNFALLYVGNNKTKQSPQQSTNMTAEILKSDLIAYKQGKSTREATIKKIQFTSSVKDEKVERDLELFGSIFAKLYDSDLSTTYYTSSYRVNYERLENFGAIFNMRVYSSNNNNGLHTIRTTRERGLTQEERNAKVNAMYPEFERSIKENILDYGRTIKSLKSNEMLMFKIRLTECKGCEMPKSIEVSVKASVLNEYGSGKTTKDNAIKSITVKKVSN